VSFSLPHKKSTSNSKNKSEFFSPVSKSSPSHEIQSTHNISSSQTQQNILNLQQTLENQSIQRLVKSGLLQPKLKINHPNDPYEREADRVAEQIMRMTSLSNMSDSKGSQIQRKCSSCQSMENQFSSDENKLKISRKPISNSNLEASDEITHQISNTGDGRPLDSTTKSFMESRFNHDFSNVRIHDDSRSNELASAVNARAFTTGSSIFLGKNESSSNKHLMAHELTHVVQQGFQNLPNLNLFNPTLEHTISRKEDDTSNITRQISYGTKTENPAIIWRENNIIIAILEFDTKQNLEKYLKNPELVNDLVSKKHALWSMLPLAIGKENSEIMPNMKSNQHSSQSNTMLGLMGKWHKAGFLDPPYWPKKLKPLPPFPVTKKQMKKSNIAKAFLGGGAAALQYAAKNSKTFALIPEGGAISTGAATVAKRSLLARMGSVFRRFSPLAIGVTILFTPSSTAPPWMDTINQITGTGYSSPQEYDWIGRLTPNQRDHLKQLPKNPDEFDIDPKPENSPASTTKSPTPLPDKKKKRRKKELLITLRLPSQKAVHAKEYLNLIKKRHLVHYPGTLRGGRNTRQRDKWDRILRWPTGSNAIYKKIWEDFDDLGITNPNRKTRPNWTRTRDQIDTQVDHRVEWQLVHPSEKGIWDEIWNYELLDQPSNGSSGSRIRQNIRREREDLVRRTKDPTWLTRVLIFNNLIVEPGPPGERWYEDEIQTGSHYWTLRKLKGM